MIKSFFISPHKFNIHESSDYGLYVKIYRKLRTNPLPGMVQPIIKGGIMGYEAILEILYEGKPLSNCVIKIFNDMVLIGDYNSDDVGKCSIRLPYNTNCMCTPFDKCDEFLGNYMLQIEYALKASPLTQESIEEAKFNAILMDKIKAKETKEESHKMMLSSDFSVN